MRALTARPKSAFKNDKIPHKTTPTVQMVRYCILWGISTGRS